MSQASLTRVFLDDERDPAYVDWDRSAIVVRSYQAFVDFVDEFPDLSNTCFSFDHDITCWVQGREKTGYDCLKYLIDRCLEQDIPIPPAQFHTMNPVGRDNMRAYYDNALDFQRRFGSYTTT